MTSPRGKALLNVFRTPDVQLGQFVDCKIRGQAIVSGFSQGRIPWPMTHTHSSRPGFIVFGDLEQAIREESRRTVAYLFGIAPHTVSTWRKALGVERYYGATGRPPLALPEPPYGEKRICDASNAKLFQEVAMSEPSDPPLSLATNEQLAHELMHRTTLAAVLVVVNREMRNGGPVAGDRVEGFQSPHLTRAGAIGLLKAMLEHLESNK